MMSIFFPFVYFFRFNYDPTVQVPPKEHPHVPVSGKDRYKFFRRPIIPFLQQVPPDVLLQSSKLVSMILQASFPF